MTRRILATVGALVWLGATLAFLWGYNFKAETQHHKETLKNHHQTYLEQQNLRLYKENRELKARIETMESTPLSPQ